ncbi:hypothetical protein G7Z17_g10476 [Cylindrodendrum hubeiense]|uniref:INO80 complex subunit B-like conserved region domain-containing protein n=1 Tax=Cylindrodendrum hubeiense TaxID=595255 RepID=A0A9P5L4S4_9HYPO|nr:hypothetical protein G7Z17_g10476 [Cylindrodendrum hubeiense]
MASRPRRSAAAKANEVISVHARLADSPERGERSTMSSRRTSGRASGATRDTHRSLTVKVSNNNLRQSTRGGRAFEGGEIVEGKRNRGARKSYVVDSSPEEDDEEEEEDEIEVEDDDDDEMDEDAEGEDEIDMDAEGEEDAEGDIEMDIAPPPPTIKVSKPSRSKPAPRASALKVVPDDDDDDDDDDLSDPADSDVGDNTMGLDETMVDDEDAEGEEIEVAGEEVDEEEEEEVDSDDEGSQDDEVDMTKLTKRQRARFEEEPQQYMKLSDEVQAKKVFTAEELSMRRQEMARRRRNLSEKRTEEVKMETINKLLKKQAPKINRKATAASSGETVDGYPKPDTVFVRWISNKNGVQVAAPVEIVESPVGSIFGGRGRPPAKMVEEVA